MRLFLGRDSPSLKASLRRTEVLHPENRFLANMQTEFLWRHVRSKAVRGACQRPAQWHCRLGTWNEHPWYLHRRSLPWSYIYIYIKSCDPVVCPEMMPSMRFKYSLGQPSGNAKASPPAFGTHVARSSGHLALSSFKSVNTRSMSRQRMRSNPRVTNATPKTYSLTSKRGKTYFNANENHAIHVTLCANAKTRNIENSNIWIQNVVRSNLL